MADASATFETIGRSWHALPKCAFEPTVPDTTRSEYSQFESEVFGPNRAGWLAACRHACNSGHHFDPDSVEGILDVYRKCGDTFRANIGQAMLEVCKVVRFGPWTSICALTPKELSDAGDKLVKRYGISTNLAADLFREIMGDPHVVSEAGATALLTNPQKDHGGYSGRLVLQRVTNGDGRLFPSVRMAFVNCSETFNEAQNHAVAYVRKRVNWPGGEGARWTLCWSGRLEAGPAAPPVANQGDRIPFELSGGSLGGAFGLLLTKLFA